VGARVTLARLAADSEVAAGWRGLAEAAGGAATPQVRCRGTVGGNLLQQVRCWYYRSPDVTCLRKGGGLCFARAGDHTYHAAIDQGPCVAPHPSTLAVALLALGAQVEVLGPDGTVSVRTLPELVGDGSNPTITHTLAPDELLLAVLLPPPEGGSRSAWFRARSREHADWPLVEAVAVIGTRTRVSLGGVANTPVLLDLTGGSAAAAVDAVDAVASPLPMTAYKVPLMKGVIEEVLERAAAAPPVPAPAVEEAP